MKAVKIVFFGTIFLCLMPVLTVPFIRDVITVMWAALSWPLQLAVFLAIALMLLLVVRVIWWTLTGRSRFTRR